jgi:hypothetical protein
MIIVNIPAKTSDFTLNPKFSIEIRNHGVPEDAEVRRRAPDLSAIPDVPWNHEHDGSQKTLPESMQTLHRYFNFYSDKV